MFLSYLLSSWPALLLFLSLFCSRFLLPELWSRLLSFYCLWSWATHFILCGAARLFHVLLYSEFFASFPSLKNPIPTHICVAWKAVCCLALLGSTLSSDTSAAYICFTSGLTICGSLQHHAFPGLHRLTRCSLFLKCTSPTLSFCQIPTHPSSPCKALPDTFR